MAHGELLAGRYAVERELGRGGSGRVLLASDTAQGGAPRAIKLVAPEHEARLRWEFGLLAKLAHPNLARVYELLRIERASAELEITAGSVALVTEVAPGRPAHELAGEQARDPAALLALSLVVADGVARALSALHAQGLVHGDVKPENIVVDAAQQQCKLVDLGLAVRADAAGAAAGTLAYMAPEVWRGERGPAADLYALGVTLASRAARGAGVGCAHAFGCGLARTRVLAAAKARSAAGIHTARADQLDRRADRARSERASAARGRSTRARGADCRRSTGSSSPRSAAVRMTWPRRSSVPARSPHCLWSDTRRRCASCRRDWSTAVPSRCVVRRARDARGLCARRCASCRRRACRPARAYRRIAWSSACRTARSSPTPCCTCSTVTR